VAKSRTLEQVERMKAKAARFVENVLDDSGRADEIADESPEEYAERKHIRVLDNPHQRRTRPMPSNKELLERVRELEDENDELQDQIDAAADILGGDEDDDDEDDGRGED
jgi:hypothetical protein